LSKVIDNDGWGISSSLLNITESKFGLLEVDWFASEHNRKLPIFFSWFWNPSSSGIDAFSERWSDKQGLFVPPICMIIHVIRKMELDEAEGVLILPCWHSAAFWPILCPNETFISSVVDYFDLPTLKEYYGKCRDGKGLFGNVELNFRMLAL